MLVVLIEGNDVLKEGNEDASSNRLDKTLPAFFSSTSGDIVRHTIRRKLMLFIFIPKLFSTG